jgi:hypothetical protein
LGHRTNTAINSVSLSPDGQWMASGGDDGTVRVWEVSSGRCFRKWDFANQRTETDNSTRVLSVAFNPNPALPILAVAVGSHIFLLHTHTITSATARDKAAVQSMLSAPQQEQTAPVPINDKQVSDRTWQQVHILLSCSCSIFSPFFLLFLLFLLFPCVFFCGATKSLRGLPCRLRYGRHIDYFSLPSLFYILFRLSA